MDKYKSRLVHFNLLLSKAFGNWAIAFERAQESHIPEKEKPSFMQLGLLDGVCS